MWVLIVCEGGFCLEGKRGDFVSGLLLGFLVGAGRVGGES